MIDHGVAAGVSPADWFFADPDRASAFCAIWKTWDGTPFKENSRAKGPGGGIDCVAIQEETFFESGAVPRFHFPRTDGDYKGHVHNTKILSFLRGTYCSVVAGVSPADIDPQSLLLASIFSELENLDVLVPKPVWPRPADHTPGTRLITGDLCIIKAKIPGVWHLAAMQDDRTFKHCAFPGGVTEGDITQGDIRARLIAVFRARALSRRSLGEGGPAANPVDA